MGVRRACRRLALGRHSMRHTQFDFCSSQHLFAPFMPLGDSPLAM
jgi:hypothetical protein